MKTLKAAHVLECYINSPFHTKKIREMEMLAVPSKVSYAFLSLAL